MKRARAVELVEGMLHRLDGDQEWPLQLVRQVWLFGSFARGAAEPHDVDVAVRFERDERMTEAVVQAVFSGGNPYALLRRALAGSSRGMQFQFEDSARQQLEAEGTVMLPLWQRGDRLDQALAVLHAIAEDPDAGRAERHDMIDAFDGLDRYIPRPVRAELIGWQQQGHIAISRVTLSDAPDDTDLLTTPDMRWAFRRWGDDSPLRRAALAGLARMQELGVELDDVDLAGQRLPTARRPAGHRSEPRWWINWKWQGYRSIPHCVTSGDGWLEVVQPTRTRPLNALVIKPGPKAAAFRS
ncbi:nucleotidyltransferase domain-containing protein [Streptomyces sp. NBC_01221]|uniref:nucleotidyltransferase domain-containing protein n=1 Tax=Streptomyces sp. NBC_01221 TaxID=2903782 RepID=UPI00225327D2|nr:nucleotidyltransferase domain-containing protein [Streptomyces sp. NBC_01221]MCX4791914.1 nucleotidyltransferase domain-containing protein [Streptomyces sp. NBC_01221]